MQHYTTILNPFLRHIQKVCALLLAGLGIFLAVKPQILGAAVVPHDPREVASLSIATIQAFGLRLLIIGTPLFGKVAK